MALTGKLSVGAFGVLGGLAAFVAYLVVSNYAAAGWAGVSALLGTIILTDAWRSRRTVG